MLWSLLLVELCYRTGVATWQIFFNRRCDIRIW